MSASTPPQQPLQTVKALAFAATVAPMSKRPPIHPDFGRRVRERREALGLRQADLADAVGTSATTIRAWENGRTGIADDRMRALAKALGCEPTDLWPDWQPQPHRVGSSRSTLRDLQQRVDAMERAVADLQSWTERARQVISERPQPDPAELRQEAEQLAGQDDADDESHRHEHGRER